MKLIFGISWEDCRWRMSEKRVLRGKKETKGWRKFHNEELQNFYSSPNIRPIRLI
jgi:hypothetical protein